MKRIIQIITLLILPLGAISQNNFSFGINLNSEFSFSTIKKSELASGLEAKGGIGIGYGTGIDIQYNMTDNLFLRSGVNYQNLNHRTSINGLRFGTSFPSEITASLKSYIGLSSISIPLDLGFQLKSNKENIRYVFGVGGLLHLRLKSKSKGIIFYGDGNEEALSVFREHINPSRFSVGIFGGIEIKWNDNVILGIEPNIRLTPNDFTFLSNSTAKTALESGVTLRLRRL